MIEEVPRESTAATDLGQPRGKLRVFISYSRDDLDFSDQLDAALQLLSFETSVDRHAISGGEAWKQRLGNLIREADTVVFVLSPASAASGICAWEVDEAHRLGKRIIPVLCRALGDASAPPLLQDLNYILLYAEPKLPRSGFGVGLTQLVNALNTDLEWLREHTRLLLRATEWHAGGRMPNRLLSGSDIPAAKAWSSGRPKGAPEPTALHVDFIRSSEEAEDARLIAQRKQLDEMTAAQEARAKALNDAEQALERTIRLQRRQVLGITGVAAILALIGWWAYGIIMEQRAVAREAGRTDIRGQIIAYAAAFGSEAIDIAPGKLTSPYTTSLVQKLGRDKNLVEAIVDTHQLVLDLTEGKQRPLISTSTNGQIYLHQQPTTRRKRVLAISADDIANPMLRLKGPPHDVDAIVKVLIEAGFNHRDVTVLRNPDRQQILEAIDQIEQSLRQQSLEKTPGQLPTPEFATRVAFQKPQDGFDASPIAKAPDDTLLLLFFSGHGVQIADTNYILPKFPVTSGELNQLGSDRIESMSLEVQRLTQRLEKAAAASIVILDTHFPRLASSPTR